MGNKYILFASLVTIFSSNNAQADWSYGAKFVATTVGACFAGGAGAYVYAANTGYDNQPKMIMTWSGATIGCITGAIISYALYHDESATLNTRINEQQKTIADLSIQLSDIQGQKQNGSFNIPKVAGNFPNPFDNLKLSEGIPKTSYDESKLPPGLNLKKCNKMLKFTLINSADDLKLNSELPSVVAVSPNFALVGFTFLYSPNNCIYPSKNGQYAEENFKGLTEFLYTRVDDWKAKQNLKN